MKLRLSQSQMTLAVTAGVFALLYGIACMRYDGFYSWRVFYNLFLDNAFLGITAVGMTFVILSGGIDLSVGSMIGFTSILLATLVEQKQMDPRLAIPLVLAIGAVFGCGMGCVIRFFDLAPFLVTLAGMFLARGLGLMINQESIALVHPIFQNVSSVAFQGLHNVIVPAVFLVTLLAAMYVASFTRFGRGIYAIGGSEQSATLMGLPVGATKIAVYTLNGFCSALAGVVYAVYTSSGNATAGTGLELDAIAAVVIGGTLLSGGVGLVFGTLLGVLILGIIQTAITFEGTLSSWWTKIVIGLLLFVFVVLQRFVSGTLKARRR